MKFPKELLAALILPALLTPLSASDCDSKTKHQTTGTKATIVEVAVGAGQFKTLAAALAAADLVDVLKTGGPFTVFAPTDAAFAKLPAGTVEELLKPENGAQLQAVLKYHVVAGRVTGSDALAAGKAKTLQGKQVTIALNEGRLQINGATVLKNDVQASNGVIHIIDTVLLPPSGHSGTKNARQHLADVAQSH